MRTAVALATAAAAIAASPAAAQTLTRGPYLQMGSDTSMMIVWRTDVAASGVVRYGTDPQVLDRMAMQSGANGREHEVTIAGLTPLTRYWYRIESNGTALAQGADHAFKTHPTQGTSTPFRLLAWGDSGDGSSHQQTVANNMAALKHEADLALGLGDLIYPSGERENYDPYFFMPYAALTKRIVIWPAIGNHDVGTDDGAPFAENFRTPANNPGNDETYYSFWYGDVLFICLDSQHTTKFLRSTSEMRVWLDETLRQNASARWKVAYFHHPPYSNGTHNDDLRIKSLLVPALEAGQIDFVLTGHSHVYERSYLISDGRVVDNNPNTYDKVNTPNAAIYIVTGAGGKRGGVGSHNLMAYAVGDKAGNTILDFENNVVHGYWIEENGDFHDVFRLSKGGDTRGPKVRAVSQSGAATELRVYFDEPVNMPAANNFAIGGGMTVNGAARSMDQRTIVLTTSAHSAGTTYTIHISGVSDVSGNLMTPSRWTYATGGEGTEMTGPQPTPDAGLVTQPDAGPAMTPDATPAPSDSGMQMTNPDAAPVTPADSGVVIPPADAGAAARDSGSGTRPPGDLPDAGDGSCSCDAIAASRSTHHGPGSEIALLLAAVALLFFSRRSLTGGGTRS